MHAYVADFTNIVFCRCLSSVIDNKSQIPLKMTRAWTFLHRCMVLHSAYWGPRSKCPRGVWEYFVRVVISWEGFQKEHLGAIAPPLTTIYIYIYIYIYMWLGPLGSMWTDPLYSVFSHMDHWVNPLTCISSCLTLCSVSGHWNNIRTRHQTLVCSAS